MKRIAIALALLGACASDQPMETAADTGAAGSVGVNSEAITAYVCSLRTGSAAKLSMANQASCPLDNWNPSDSFYETWNTKRTTGTSCMYLGNKISVKIDNPVENNLISCDFRISKTTAGSDPTFRPWLRATCLPNHSTCTLTTWR